MSEDVKYNHRCPYCGNQLFVTRLEVDTHIPITASGYNDAESSIWNVTHLEIGCDNCGFCQIGLLDLTE